MKKIPAFQFYPADWRKDLGVQSLSYFDRGVWFEILCLMHESEQRGKLLLNGRAMSNEVLARSLGLDKQVLTRTLETLLELGVAEREDSGALINRRMIRDERLRHVRTENGKKGGNPALVNQEDNQKPTTPVKQKSTPSSSSSSSDLEHTHNAGDWDFPIRELIEAFPNIVLTPTMAGFIEGEVKPGDEVAWASTLKTYRMNYDPANNRYLPEKTGNLLGVFRSEKAKLEKVKNGTVRQSGKSNLGALEQSADYFESKYGPA